MTIVFNGYCVNYSKHVLDIDNQQCSYHRYTDTLTHAHNYSQLD